ncbi:MAG: competence type IV pilus major pilin ComGC [Bacillota bacterium]
MKKDKGFTLIEMLIVLLVISVLLLITIPNVTKHNASIQKKGCDGLINMVQAQVTAYEIDFKETPSEGELIAEDYLKNSPVCPNGNSLVISADGEVTEVVPAPESP